MPKPSLRPLRRHREQERLSGIMPLTRELGEKLGGDPWCKPIPELQAITGPQRPTRGRWPADVWEEMQAIYEGREP